MADDERPSKIQKRGHDSPEGEAAFAPSEQPQPSSEAPQPEMGVDEQQEADETNDASTANPSKPGPPPGMTKSAWKKLRRQQEWEAGREQRKVLRKEKAKARKQRKRDEYAAQRANGDTDTAEGSALPPRLNPHKKERQALEKARNQRATQVPVTFVFDCSFDDLMMDKELKSLGQQITRAYSDNRSAPYRAHLAVSSFGGKLKERFDGVLGGHYKAWKGFRVCEEDYVKVGEQAKQWMADPKMGGKVEGTLKETQQKTANDSGETKEESAERDAYERDALIAAGETIYLSSEGTETLHTLKPYHTYVIGGLVDKNRYKGICHKRATERGIKTAKLPIGEFLQMNSRAVLATNHVSEIMLRWLECGDWGEAFMKVIPKRKGGQLRSTGEEEDGEGEGDAEAEAEVGGAEAKEKGEDVTVTEKGNDAATVATGDDAQTA